MPVSEIIGEAVRDNLVPEDDTTTTLKMLCALAACSPIRKTATRMNFPVVSVSVLRGKITRPKTGIRGL